MVIIKTRKKNLLLMIIVPEGAPGNIQAIRISIHEEFEIYEEIIYMRV